MYNSNVSLVWIILRRRIYFLNKTIFRGPTTIIILSLDGYFGRRRRQNSAISSIVFQKRR